MRHRARVRPLEVEGGKAAGRGLNVTTAETARARAGKGPTLIEAQTYRFDEHQVGLVVPGTPYRTLEEVAKYKAHRDPIVLFRRVLLSNGIAANELEAIESEVATAVAEAIQFARDSPLPDVAGLYDNLYSRPLETASP